jgi:hypothetical protein
MYNWLVPYARMFNRYVSSPLLGVIDLYLMLGSLLGICLVIYYVCLTCFFDFYIMLGSLPDKCLVNVEVFFTCTLCWKVYQVFMDGLLNNKNKTWLSNTVCTTRFRNKFCLLRP